MDDHKKNDGLGRIRTGDILHLVTMLLLVSERSLKEISVVAGVCYSEGCYFRLRMADVTQNARHAVLHSGVSSVLFGAVGVLAVKH
ncbi:MAG: hypothetical protein ACXV5H_01055 [Halobacteriota archaeon]